jgi:hypothetical protein
MALPAPVIVLPSGGADYATDISTQTLSGTTSTDTKEIQVNGSLNGVSYTEGESVWAWTGGLSLGENILNIVAVEKGTELSSPAATIKITLVRSEDFVTVTPPTGVKTLRYQSKIEIVNAQNSEPNTVGYNYYVSLQSGGVNGFYAKINIDPVIAFTFYEDKTQVLNTTTDTAGNIRVTTTTEEVTREYYYSIFFDQVRFEALVTEGLLPAAVFGESTPFFFVITAVIYDPVLGQVSESAYSVELQSSPLTITTGIKDLPARTQNDIILTMSQELLVANAGTDVKPGTVIRDMMDPISEEMARIYVIQDFMARSLSVSALQDFDDANGDTISDPVETSIPKKALQLALFLSDPADVQRIIDEQFDKLASNADKKRKAAEPAIGTVTYYTETAPIRDMTINEGAIVSTLGDLDQNISAQSYQTLSTKILQYQNREQYFNSVTGRYEIDVDVVALDSGEAGNTDAFTVEVVSSGADSDFFVENTNPISFGRDIESNHDLATGIELAFFVDTGTEGGYVKVAAGISGVRRVRVEKANDPLMIRDYDALRKKHVGGKVDVYIQGTRTAQVTDQIAFSFESIISSQGAQTGETFVIINVAAFQFKTTNPRVTAHTPIFEVSRVYNATRAAEYDISGYQIIGDGDTIDLDETKPTNVFIGLASDDVIKVDYKFRSSDTFILEHQPVDEIISVTGQLSGTLTTDNWELVKLQDPLEEGNSTIAQDSIQIKFANNLPLTEFQTITEEPHVIILGKPEPLDYLGADPESIIVRNSDKTIRYVNTVDYRIDPGTDTDPTTIIMIESGNLTNGQEILVDYIAIENFVITYTTNELLSTVQTELDEMKHACADAIAKQAIENNVDMALTIIPKSGVSDFTTLTSRITTSIANFIGQLGIGRALTQSDVDHQIRKIADVDYVVVPFGRMIKANDAFIVRDNIGNTQFEIFNEGLVKSYVTVAEVLSFGTVDQGGPENLFKGIFEDTVALTLQDDSLDVSGGAGRGYIRDDGKIIVSTKDGQLPDVKNYQVAYYVYGEEGSEDINVAQIESLRIGTLTIVYDTPRDLIPVL